MATITLGGNDYDSFEDIAGADIFLAADPQYYASWDIADDDTKARGLITASRFVLALCWAAGDPPDFATAPDSVRQAVSLLAATTVGNASALSGENAAGSNIRRARAGSAEIEYFGKTEGQGYASAASLPPRVKALLDGDELLCTSSTSSAIGVPFYGGTGAPRCNDACDDGLTWPYS